MIYIVPYSLNKLALWHLQQVIIVIELTYITPFNTCNDKAGL